MDLDRELSEPQRRAVMHDTGPLLVLAGAGSGKTRVITYRIARLVGERGVDPWRLLAVTFTNKAAGEMRERVERLIGPEAAHQVWLGTFHATCARLLRRTPDLAGLDAGFTIYDDDDSLALVGRVIRDLGIESTSFQPRAIQGRIDRAKQDGRGPEDLPHRGWHEEQVARIWTEYQLRLQRANAVDFGDLLVRTVGMLERHETLREELRRRFTHLLVDEFQDTNHVQYALLRLLVNDARNLCVVGDDDQSIYRWRGAEVQNILGFGDDFPGAEVVRLEQNYRSTDHVLRAAAAVIGRNRSRHPKQLWTRNPPGDPVRVVLAGDEREEAAAVARAVETLRAEGVRLADVAVFYRVNAQSRVLEEAMRSRGLPYVVVGGFRFYERAEVKNLLCYLRLVVNPADDAAFLRIVNVPARGVGRVSVERLAAWARERGRPLLAAAADAESIDGLPAAGGRAMAELARRFVDWTAGAVEGPVRLAERLFDESGYRRALLEEKGPEAESRLQNVRELIGSIAAFTREDPAPTLLGWLEHVALQSAVDELDAATDRLVLMTVHAAKGLEFDTVFVVGLEEGIFPYVSRDRDEDADEDRKHQEEERRLCYVAMTRARRRLWLTHVRHRTLFGGTRENAPSRFLADVPSELLEALVLPGAREPLGPSTAGPAAGGPAWSRGRRGGFGDPRSPVKVTRYPRRAPADDVDEFSQVTRDEISQAVAADAGVDLRVGDRVRHVKYGVGTVVDLEPGREVKVLVEFPAWGRKKVVGRFIERA